jgi:hypothetical protein
MIALFLLFCVVCGYFFLRLCDYKLFTDATLFVLFRKLSVVYVKLAFFISMGLMNVSKMREGAFCRKFSSQSHSFERCPEMMNSFERQLQLAFC